MAKIYRRCRTCMEKKPLTAEYWRRYHKAPDGFIVHCKECTKKSIKAHYRKWYAKDVNKRGEVGVRCLLWAPSCGECEDWTTCWRLDDIDEKSEDYPVELPQ